MQDILRRLDRLEEDNRRLRRRVRGLQGLGAGTAGLALAALLLGDASGEASPRGALAGWGLEGEESALPPVAEVVRARRFEVVGGDERKFVAAMAASPAGDGFVETWTDAGWRSTRLGSADDGRVGLVAFEKEGSTAFRVVSREGGSELVLSGAAGRRHVARLGSGDHGGALSLWNPEGMEIASVSPTEAGSAAVKVFDDSGRPLVTLGEGSSGQGIVRVSNDAGFPLIELTTDRERNGRITVGNREGLVLMTLPEPPPPGIPALEMPQPPPGHPAASGG